VIPALALLLAAAPVQAGTPAQASAPAQAGPADNRSPGARFDDCVKKTDSDPAAAQQIAIAWAGTGGGTLAAQCLGLARSALNDWKGAADAFSAAADIAQKMNDRHASDLWVSAGNAALADGDTLRARDFLSKGIADPDLSGQLKGEALLDRARADVAANDLASARSDMNDALALVPGDPMAWLLSATLARRMGDGNRAADDIKEAMSRAPEQADIVYEAGNIAATNGDIAGARLQWSHAVNLDPNSGAGRSALAELKATGDDAAAAGASPQKPASGGR